MSFDYKKSINSLYAAKQIIYRNGSEINYIAVRYKGNTNDETVSMYHLSGCCVVLYLLSK